MAGGRAWAAVAEVVTTATTVATTASTTTATTITTATAAAVTDTTATSPTRLLIPWASAVVLKFELEFENPPTLYLPRSSEASPSFTAVLV